MELPPNVKEADTKYPKIGQGIGYEKLTELGLDFNSGWGGRLVFHKVPRFGWVIATLLIRKPGRRSTATTDRTYGITVADQKPCTVGMGPHVEATVEVYLTKANLKRMMPYIETWKKGMSDAGVIRDRISSRRAATTLRRSNPNSSWFGGSNYGF